MSGKTALRLSAAAALLCLLLPACGGNDPHLVPFPSRGAALVSHRGYLYVLGGISADGEYSDRVLYAQVFEDGSLSEWKEGAGLPTPRAYHTCVAWGDEMYLIGGLNGGGYLDDVSFAYLGSDGRIGFGSEGTGTWTTNPRKLPRGIAHAAGLAVEGYLYLFGGETADGLTDSVQYAHLWSDGQVGFWRESRQTLPGVRQGSAVVKYPDPGNGDMICLSGGMTGYDYLPDLLYSRISADGVLGAWIQGPGMPEPRAFHGSFLDGTTLVVSGGMNRTGYLKTMARGIALSPGGEPGSWQSADGYAGFWTGQSPVTRGYACLLSQEGDTESSVHLLALSSRKTDPPVIRPGSGYVNKNGITPFTAGTGGDVIRYSVSLNGIEPPDPTGASPSSISKIIPPAVVKLRAFRPGWDPSDVVRVEYRPVSGSMFLFLSGTVFPAQSGSPFRTILLQERYSNGSTKQVNAVWYRLSIRQAGEYVIEWEDSEVSGSRTADILVSLFEGTLFSVLKDVDEAAVDALDSPGSSGVRIALSEGEYYLQVRLKNPDLLGGSAGLRVSGAEE